MDSSLSSLAKGRCMQDICADVMRGGVDAIDHPAQIPPTHLLPTNHGEPSFETPQDHKSESTKSTSTRSTSPGALRISPELPCPVTASSSASSTSSARSGMQHLNVTTTKASGQKFSPRSTLLPLQPDSPEGEQEREDGRGPQPGTLRAFQGPKPPHLRRPSGPANHQLPPVPTPPGTPRSSTRQLRGPRSLLKSFTSLQERPSQPSRLCDHLHHHFPRSPTDTSVPPASPRQPRSPLGSFQEPPSSLPSASLGSSSPCNGDLSQSLGEGGDPCSPRTARPERSTMPMTPSSPSSPSYVHAAWQRLSSPVHDKLSRFHSRTFGWGGRFSPQGRAASPIIWSSPTLSEPLEEGPVPDHMERSPLRHSLMSALTSPLRYGNSDSNSSRSGDHSRSHLNSKAATRSTSSSRVPTATVTASGSSCSSIGSSCSSIGNSIRPHAAGSRVSYSSEFHQQSPHRSDSTGVPTQMERRRRSSSSSCGGSSSSRNWSSIGARAPPPDLFVNDTPSPPPPCQILPTDRSAQQLCGASPSLWRSKGGLQGREGAEEEPREKGGDAGAASMRMTVACERVAAAPAASAAAAEPAAPAADSKAAASAEAADCTGPWHQGTVRLEGKSDASELGMNLESSPQHPFCFPQFHRSPLQPSLGRTPESGAQTNIGVSVHADLSVLQYPSKAHGSSEHRESERPLNAGEEAGSVHCRRNTSSQPWGWKDSEGRAAAPPSLSLEDEGEQEWEWQPSQRDVKTPLGAAAGRKRGQATSPPNLNPLQTLMTSATLMLSSTSPSSSSLSSSPHSVSTVPAPFSTLPWTPTGGSDEAPQVFTKYVSEAPGSAAFAAAPTPPAGVSQQGTAAGASPCAVFTADELKLATDDWSPSTVIGRGSFGTVYRGLVRGTPAAIKRQEGGEEQDLKPEYEAELKILSRLRGPHIVPLLGHSPETRALVYEYLPSGSLQDWLANCHKVPFTPFQRLRILCDIAYALLTLHGGNPGVVHRDLKPANVLLDGDMRAKLGDVGTACVLELDEEEGGEEDEDHHDVIHDDDDDYESDVAGPSDEKASDQPLGLLVHVKSCSHGVRHDGRGNTRINQESRMGKLLESGDGATRWRSKVRCRGVVSYQVVGTVGYIDPEMMSTFRVTPAVDVYAFGLIALQLLTGEPKVTRLRERLEREADFTGCTADYTLPAHFSLTVKSVMRMADGFSGEWPRDAARDVATLALRCASRHSVDRPCLESEVLPVLWRCMESL